MLWGLHPSQGAHGPVLPPSPNGGGHWRARSRGALRNVRYASISHPCVATKTSRMGTGRAPAPNRSEDDRGLRSTRSTSLCPIRQGRLAPSPSSAGCEGSSLKSRTQPRLRSGLLFAGALILPGSAGISKMHDNSLSLSPGPAVRGFCFTERPRGLLPRTLAAHMCRLRSARTQLSLINRAALVRETGGA